MLEPDDEYEDYDDTSLVSGDLVRDDGEEEEDETAYREEVLAAVRRYGQAAGVRRRAAEGRPRAAVRQNGWALYWAAAPLKADREVVLEAVRKDGDALWAAADSLKADREVVLQVRKDGDVLWYAAESLKADHEVVLEAVRHDKLLSGEPVK